MENQKLHNSISIPSIVMSTNQMQYKEMYNLVSFGLDCGYRAFDTARDYFNEDVVGKVFSKCLKEKTIKREDIFITTKIGNTQQISENIYKQIDISLKNLKTEYVDLWMMHWPYPDYFVKTYKKMEEVYKNGKAKAIGIANCQVRHLKTLLNSDIEIIPHCVQFECHPLRTCDELVDLCKKNNIAIQAYSPLCRMIEPIKTSEILKSISQKYNKTISQIILRWHLQRGTIPVFKSTNVTRIKENLNIFDFELTENEICQISSMNMNYKYHLESASCPGF